MSVCIDFNNTGLGRLAGRQYAARPGPARWTVSPARPFIFYENSVPSWTVTVTVTEIAGCELNSNWTETVCLKYITGSQYGIGPGTDGQTDGRTMGVDPY